MGNATTGTDCTESVPLQQKHGACKRKNGCLGQQPAQEVEICHLFIFVFVFFSHVYLVLLMTCLFVKTFLLLLSQIRQQPPLFPEKKQRSCWEVGFSAAKGCKNSRNQWPGSGFMPYSRYVEDRARRLLSAHKELNYINKHASTVHTETEAK